MWSTSSLPLLSVSLGPRMVVTFRVLSLGQTELFNYVLRIIIVSSCETIQLYPNYLYYIGILDE